MLSTKFKEAFPHSIIPPLPKLLALISASTSKQSDNHFFASVVKSKDHVLVYHDVVQWMLKRNMLITLHLRIRIVVTQDLKSRVKNERESYMTSRSALGNTPSSHNSNSHKGKASVPESAAGSTRYPSFFFSPKTAHRISRRVSSIDSEKSGISELDFYAAEKQQFHQPQHQSTLTDSSNSEIDEDDSGWDTTEDHLWPSVITDPGKATPMQRRWLSAMSEGKDPVIAKRFEQ